MHLFMKIVEIAFFLWAIPQTVVVLTIAVRESRTRK